MQIVRIISPMSCTACFADVTVKISLRKYFNFPITILDTASVLVDMLFSSTELAELRFKDEIDGFKSQEDTSLKLSNKLGMILIV